MSSEKVIAGDNHFCLDCGKPTGKPFARYCDEDRWKHRGKKRTYRLSAEAEAYLRKHYKGNDIHNSLAINTTEKEKP